MKSFVKAIAVLCGLLLPIFLFIFLYRMSIGKDAFFGISDFFDWVETQDFYTPIKSMLDDFAYLTTTYSDWITNSWSNINNAWDALLAIGKSIGGVLGFISYPVVLLYHYVKMAIDYLLILFDFFAYVSH